MKKTRMISVIAASLLTATVVFTGCGGGGSSSTPVSSSSSSVSSTSSTSSIPASNSSSSSAGTCLPGQSCGNNSSAAPTVKTVKVSDGYVLQATVKCKESNGDDIAQAVATNNPGEYQFADVASCPVLCAKDGVIDVNDNGQVDAGEPYAPKMTAPGDYANINPYTVLIQNGMTPAEVAAAFGLPADTNFDVAIPESQDPNFIKNAVLLSAVLSYIERQSGTRGILPTPGSGAVSSTSTSSSSSVNSSEEMENGAQSSVSALTLAILVEKLKSGLTIDDLLPEDLKPLKQALDSSEIAPDQYDEVVAPFLKKYNGAYNGTSSSTQSSSSTSSQEQNGGGILPTPTNGGIATGGETFPPVSSGVSSIPVSSSESSSNSSTSSEGGLLPTPSSSPMPVSSSSEASSSSSSVPSNPPTPSLSSSSSSSSSSVPSNPPTPSLGGSSSSSAPTPTEETPGA